MDAAPTGETYDEDLGWILERLADRAGADCGFILRCHPESGEHSLLARHRVAQELSADALGALCRALQDQEACERVQSLPIDLTPWGGTCIRVLLLRFTPAPGVVVIAAICRPESSFNLLQTYVANRLEPVLARYIRLWWLHRTERRRAEIFQLALDRSDIGILLLNRRGRLLYDNPAARALLQSGDALRRCADNVTTSDPREAPHLSRAIQAAGGDRSHGARQHALSSLLVVPRVDRRALIVSVVGVDRRPVEPDDAAVVLYLLDPDEDLAALLAPAFRIYRLTVTEARLVARLVGGSDLTDAATSLNLAVQTARSYLKQIFQKTGTNRQAELVRVMCGSAARATMVGEFSLP